MESESHTDITTLYKSLLVDEGIIFPQTARIEGCISNRTNSSHQITLLNRADRTFMSCTRSGEHLDHAYKICGLLSSYSGVISRKIATARSLICHIPIHDDE
jgi:hypothetical protein